MNAYPQTDVLKTKSTNKLIYLNYYEPTTEVLQATKNIFYYDESYKDKILVTGPRAKEFLNRLFQKRLNFHQDSFYDLIVLKFKNYYEVQVIKFKENKYFVIANDLKFLIKRFRKIKRQVKLVCLFDVTRAYRLYSIFNLDQATHSSHMNYPLIKTCYQNYIYYNILEKQSDSLLINQFKKDNFLKVGLETINIFLYNNNVLPYFNNLNRKTKINVAAIIYKISLKGRFNLVKLEFLETTFHNNIIYSIKKRKIGRILNTYQILSSSNPLAFALIKNNNSDNYFFLKHNRRYHIGKKLQTIKGEKDEQFNYYYN